MKNLPCFVFLTPIAGLGLLTLASAWGFSFPFAFVAAHFIGFSCAAGVLATFLKDYAPCRHLPVSAEICAVPSKRGTEPAARVAIRQRRSVGAAGQRPKSTTGGVMPALGLANDPATLSFS